MPKECKVKTREKTRIEKTISRHFRGTAERGGGRESTRARG